MVARERFLNKQRARDRGPRTCRLHFGSARFPIYCQREVQDEGGKGWVEENVVGAKLKVSRFLGIDTDFAICYHTLHKAV